MAKSHASSIDNIRSFDSLEAFLVYCRDDIPHNSRGKMCRYFNMQSYDSCLNSLEHGNTSTVPAAQKLIDKMEQEGLFTYGSTEVSTSIVGFMPCVPNYISGQPNDMFTIVETEEVSLNAPLRIYFETTVAMSVSEAQLVNRGVAVLALALALSRSRPVELHALSISASGRNAGAYGVAVRLPTTPMDLPRVAWVLASQGYSRNLGFTSVIALEESYSDHLDRAWKRANNQDRELSIRDTFKLEPQDIVIIRECDDQQLMLSNPVQWVKNMIVKHSNAIQKRERYDKHRRSHLQRN